MLLSFYTYLQHTENTCIYDILEVTSWINLERSLLVPNFSYKGAAHVLLLVLVTALAQSVSNSNYDGS